MELISIKQVAASLPEVTTASVRWWCIKGKVPGARKLPNGRWVVPRAWLEALVSTEVR